MADISLDDKFTKQSGRVYLTGSQALVRLPIMQKWRDSEAGFNTAGFISGYRGSPLGVYDIALWQGMDHVLKNDIHFEPGVNEELAATAVWGTQQVNLIGESKYDGVFAMWYGKGPGVDRAGDALKHGSYAGSSEKGGVLVLCGDDHAARSSSVAHQSEQALIHYGMPILHPATVQEYLDFGLYGIALSRYSGCWVGFKCITDTVEGSASVSVDAERVAIQLPEDHDLPEGGLNLQLGVLPLNAESKLYRQRHLATQAFVRANKLDRVALGGGNKRLGIVTTGKSYLDVMEALSRMGITEERAEQLGLSVYKVAMVYPLEPEGLKEFASGCQELLVVEEKRQVMEGQIASILYNLSEGERPQLVGKQDNQGNNLLPVDGELDPDKVLQVIGARLLALVDDQPLSKRLSQLAPVEQLAATYGGGQGALMRLPSFCAGCPHNTSTNVPDGSIAMAGIGCHGLATWLPGRNTVTLYQMGGEGAAWIGQAPFIDDKNHIFQNLGDGTYFHSGLLAIRANVAAGTNITYKVLVNGAISMTGGQPIEGEQFDGGVTAPHVAHQVHSEGAKRVAVVTDELERHNPKDFPAGTTFHHRDDLEKVQKELREHKGVSVIVYEQACATERRRLRKRGKYHDPDKRLFINEAVCEGCGDCGVQSNCIALEPNETGFGRKRKINQSACNKDFSCVKGMCPSFVTLYGATPKKAQHSVNSNLLDPAVIAALPEPKQAALEDTFSILVAGIGGNGVITIGALLGIAAHMEQKPCTVLDITGLSQRNGPVTSHIRFASEGETRHAARIPQGAADLVLGADLVVTSGAEGLSKMSSERTSVVFNSYVVPTSAFASNPDLDFDTSIMENAIKDKSRPGQVFSADATQAGLKILGDAIGANLFLVGYAWQQGLIPLSRQSIEKAIELNGVAVEMNSYAFALGRLAVVKPELITEQLNSGKTSSEPQTLQALISDRENFLTDYQDKDYALRFRQVIKRVIEVDEKVTGVAGELSETVVRNLSKLMAYKDEYEVARLYTRPEFMQQLNETFEGKFKLEFNLAPPLLARRDKESGRYRKMTFGPWMLKAFGLLAKLKGLRGGRFDLFGYSSHRKGERQLINWYLELIDYLVNGLERDNYQTALQLAALPEQIRGYDLVKEENIESVFSQVTELKGKFEQPEKIIASSAVQYETP